jgi:branched-chain amino acid transport system permease protein
MAAGETVAKASPGIGVPASQKLAFAPMVALIVASPFLLCPVFLMKVLCFSLFAAAFNLLIGFVGLLSFGHAAYFGMGSYVSAHAAKVWGFTPELAILSGAAVAAGLGAAFGWLAILRSGSYFAMITLALEQMVYFFCFAMITLALEQMVYFFCVQAEFTGGEDGIQTVPRGRLLGVLDLADDMTLYRVVTAIFLAGFLFLYRVVHAPFGQVLKAIRENEPRAISLGYRSDDYKLIAFVLPPR